MPQCEEWERLLDALRAELVGQAEWVLRGAIPGWPWDHEMPQRTGIRAGSAASGRWRGQVSAPGLQPAARG